MTFPIRGFNLVESVLRHDEAELRRFLRRMRTLNFNTLIAHYDYGWRRFSDVILEETAQADVDVALMVFGPRTFLDVPGFTPQWLAKSRDGQPLTRGLECDSKPCCHEPEAIEAYEVGAKTWLCSLPPAIRHVQMRCGDGVAFCECERCRVLSVEDRWQPFVDATVRALQSTRPNLICEMDVYVQRYRIPACYNGLQRVDRFMFDTFPRDFFTPLERESPCREDMDWFTGSQPADAASPNTFLATRLTEWAREFPGKTYIHENLMKQGLLGIFQHNTGVMLEDLKLFHRLGLPGVIYEAYEPGYEFFSDAIETIAHAMQDISVVGEYEPSLLERQLTSQPQSQHVFGTDLELAIERYIDDPVALKHIENYRSFHHAPTLENVRRLAAHAFEHPERLDSLMTGFFGCWCAKNLGNVDFSAASAQTQEMLNHRKLWDFMEKLPDEEDPRSTVKTLILDALQLA